MTCHPERGAKRRSRRTTAVLERADRPSTSRLRRFAQDDKSSARALRADEGVTLTLLLRIPHAISVWFARSDR